MEKVSHIAIGAIGVFMVFLSLGYLAQFPSVVEIWPWQGYGSELSLLSFYFLSSIALAIAGPLLWIAASGNVHTSAGGGLNLAITFGGIGAYSAMSSQHDPENGRLIPAAIFLGVSALLNFAVFLATKKMPPRDLKPMPGPVKYSFWLFIVTLVLVGTSLTRNSPNILPWDVTPEGSVVYGWIFLGAAVYFAYALRKPYWEYCAGPLIGFLAYDIVLIFPFIQRFSEVPDQQRLSLIVYTAVVVYSGILATYYLFVNKDTKLRRSSA